jgi:precorrin-3B synthase
MATTVCAPGRRGTADRCPGALELHDAEDGALARIRTPGGRLAAGQLRALARAVALGNGLADLTSRANVQVRGLAHERAGELAGLLTDARLLPSPEHERARNVISSPLAGRHPRALAATDDVVAELDRLLCAEPALAALPGRFLFAVDDGSGLALDHRADVALVALPDRFALALAGRLTDGRGTPAVAIAAALAFLDVRDGAWRIADAPGGAEALAARLGVRLAGRVPEARRIDPGVVRQRDRRVAVTALVPLGRLDGATLAGLAAIAPEIRISTSRTVTVPDVEPARAGEVRRALAGLGLELSPDSGWVGLSACAGLGACPRARLDVRAAASRRAAVRDPRGGAEHWAACERRCGERATQVVSVAPSGDRLLVRRGEREDAVPTAGEALEVLA